MIVDNEELICIVLRRLLKEFAHFFSAIRTRSDPITYEQLAIMLQSEEQAITDHMDSISYNLAMFASNGKANDYTSNQSQNHGLGRGRNNTNKGRGGADSIMVEINNIFYHFSFVAFCTFHFFSFLSSILNLFPYFLLILKLSLYFVNSMIPLLKLNLRQDKFHL